MKVLLALTLILSNPCFAWEYVYFFKSGVTKIALFDIETVDLHSATQGPTGSIQADAPFSDLTAMAALDTVQGVGYSIPGWYYSHTPAKGSMIASQSIFGATLIRAEFSSTVLSSGVVLPETFSVVLSGNMPVTTFDYITPSLHGNLYAADAGYKYDTICDCSMWVWADINAMPW